MTNLQAMRNLHEAIVLQMNSLRITPPKREYQAWLLAAAVLYILWSLVLRPQALDFKNYVFAGYASREGVSPYTRSTGWDTIVKENRLSPFLPPYPYPPLLNQIMSVFVAIPYWVLRTAFLLFSIAISLWSVAIILSRNNTAAGPPRLSLISLLFFLPILNCLAAGNIQIILLGAVSVMFCILTFSSFAHPADQLKYDLISGSALGFSLLLKPVLWPLLLWTIFRRHFAIALGCALSVVTILLVSVVVYGVTPWFEYMRALPKLFEVQPYIEDQSVVAVIARLGAPDVSEVVKVILPIVLLGCWFLLYRQLPAAFELVSLTTISVLASPIVWYYYFILLLPVFGFLFGQDGHMGKRSQFLVVVTYVLIQVHGVIWSHASGNFIAGNLALFGLLLLSGLLFYQAYKLNGRVPVALDSIR